MNPICGRKIAKWFGGYTIFLVAANCIEKYNVLTCPAGHKSRPDVVCTALSKKDRISEVVLIIYNVKYALRPAKVDI